jgi:hypothetical protein
LIVRSIGQGDPVKKTMLVVLALSILPIIPPMPPDARAAESADYHPIIEPARFQARVDHPYFPLVPGTTYHYVEAAGTRLSDDVVTVTHETKVIVGVTCTVVHDQLKTNGMLVEDTYDWYAQDKQGNVWYFGEDSREFKPVGEVSTEGSWEAGVHGAQPGIIMKAELAPGAPYRQEYLAGHAEDMGQIVAVGDSVKVPYGSFRNCVRIKEWSAIEKGSGELKWYAKGVGFVRGEGAGETVTLVSVRRP